MEDSLKKACFRDFLRNGEYYSGRLDDCRNRRSQGETGCLIYIQQSIAVNDHLLIIGQGEGRWKSACRAFRRHCGVDQTDHFGRQVVNNSSK